MTDFPLLPKPAAWMYSSARGVDLSHNRWSEGLRRMGPPDMVEDALFTANQMRDYTAALESALAAAEAERREYERKMDYWRDKAKETMAERDALRADERRMDWLADTKNAIGQVLLPTECVTNNVHSLRAAIDAAMALDNAREAQEAGDEK